MKVLGKLEGMMDLLIIFKKCWIILSEGLSVETLLVKLYKPLEFNHFLCFLFIYLFIPL